MFKAKLIPIFILIGLVFSACGTAGEDENINVGKVAFVGLEHLEEDFKQTSENLEQGVYPNLTGTISSNFLVPTQVSPISLIHTHQEKSFEEFASQAEIFFSQFQKCTPENIIVSVFDENTGETRETSLAEIRNEGTEQQYNGVEGLIYRGELEADTMQFTLGRTALWTNRGAIAKLNSELSPHPCIHSYGGEVYDFRVGADDKMVIQLPSGEISLKDAINVFDKEINQNYFLENSNPDLTYQVYSVIVCDITDSAQALRLMCRAVYNNIPFDTFYGEGSGLRDVPGLKPYNTSGIDMANAMLIEPDVLDATVNIDRIRTVKPEPEIEKILPFSSAIEIISQQLTQATTFEVEYAEMVYIADSDVSVTEQETVQTMQPVWKVCVTNPNNQARYNYYVDVVNGELTAMEEIE